MDHPGISSEWFLRLLPPGGKSIMNDGPKFGTTRGQPTAATVFLTKASPKDISQRTGQNQFKAKLHKGFFTNKRGPKRHTQNDPRRSPSAGYQHCWWTSPLFAPQGHPAGYQHCWSIKPLRPHKGRPKGCARSTPLMCQSPLKPLGLRVPNQAQYGPAKSGCLTSRSLPIYWGRQEPAHRPQGNQLPRCLPSLVPQGAPGTLGKPKSFKTQAPSTGSGQLVSSRSPDHCCEILRENGPGGPIWAQRTRAPSQDGSHQKREWH